MTVCELYEQLQNFILADYGDKRVLVEDYENLASFITDFEATDGEIFILIGSDNA